MSQGRLIYFGTPENAVAFFAQNGYPVPEFTNPADFYLDVVTKDGDSADADNKVEGAIEKLANAYQLIYLQEQDENKVYVDLFICLIN